MTLVTFIEIFVYLDCFCLFVCFLSPPTVIQPITMFVFHACVYINMLLFCVCLQLVGQFIARAVADQILSVSYIDGYKGKVDCEHARFVFLEHTPTGRGLTSKKPVQTVRA